MARAHTRKSGEDPFTSLASGQILSTSAAWSDAYLDTATYEWDEDADLTSVIFNVPGAFSRKHIISYVGDTPGSADYTVGVEYGGEVVATRKFWVGPCARITGTGAGWDGYVLFYYHPHGGSSTALQLYRYNNNSPTALGSSHSVKLVSGDKIYIEVVGTGATVEVKGYLNATEVCSASDSSDPGRLVATGLPGINGTSSATGSGNPKPKFLTFELYEATIPFTGDGFYSSDDGDSWTAAGDGSGVIGQTPEGQIINSTSNTPAALVCDAVLEAQELYGLRVVVVDVTTRLAYANTIGRYYSTNVTGLITGIRA